MSRILKIKGGSIMSIDADILPWEVFVALAIIVAMITVFSLVRWVFRPKPKRFPTKRLVLFFVCIGLVFYAYQGVDDFSAKFRAGLNTNTAFTSDTPQFPELASPRYSQSPDQLFAASEAAIQQQRGWQITNIASDHRSLEVSVGVLFGMFEDQMKISFVPEGSQTRVDVQSHSLKGSGDFGANRRHILQYLKALNQELGQPSE